MTTEDDFQNALDLNPDDWQTRLVFADWLDERGDRRGPGYRALAVQRMWPDKSEFRCLRPWEWVNFGPRHAVVPSDWNSLLRYPDTLQIPGAMIWDARRAAEDAIATAFALLPPERRAELLTRPATARTTSR